MFKAKKLRLWLIVAAVLLVIFVGFQLTFRSKIQISVNEGSALSTDVRVDGRTVSPSGAGGRMYIATVRPGKHKVEVYVAGFQPYVSEVSTSPQSTQSVSVELKKQTAVEAAKEASDSPENETRSGERLFGDGSWLVYFSQIQGGEGGIVVGRFSTTESKWKIIDQGSAVDLSDPEYENAPSDLRSYLEVYQ